MPKSLLTSKQIDYIKQHRLEQPATEMARKFGLHKDVVSRWMRKNKLSVPKDLILKWRAEAMIGKTTATVKEDRYIKKNYLRVPIKTIAKKLKRSHTFIVRRLEEYGLTIPEELRNERKAIGMYRKGQTPMNKGKKMVDYMSSEAIEAVKKTMFKKGNISPQTIPGNGHIRIRKTKGRNYKYLKISLGRWVALHIYKWENKNGKIPKGMCLWFKDGNYMNCTLKNLELITRAENLRRNARREEMPDNLIAGMMSHNNPELRAEIKKHPHLIEIKRQSIILNRTINEQHETKS